jgi:hypothetical protein
MSGRVALTNVEQHFAFRTCHYNSGAMCVDSSVGQGLFDAPLFDPPRI